MKTVFSISILLLLAVSFLTVAVNLDFGEPAVVDMDEYFLANGQEETGANNIVTAILFDYRGFDTMGEAAVLFTAVLGVGLVFRQLRKDEEYEND